MKVFISFILVVLFIHGYTQNEYVKVDSIMYEGFHFPILVGSRSPKVVYKINTHLQLSELELVKGKEKEHIFEQVDIDNGSIYGGKEGMFYEILTNSENMFSVEFNQMSCGMTCAHWTSYYNFNPQNGDRYFLQDFFDEENYEVFREFSTEKRKTHFEREMESLTELTTKKISEYIVSAIENDHLKQFYLAKDSIFIDNVHLLNKHDRNFDIASTTSIAIEEIHHLLNDFGTSALISGENLANFESLTEPQLYSGNIGDKYEFVLLFRNYHNTDLYDGIYAYLTYGVGINLEGKFEDNEFHLEEKNEQFDTIGYLNFQRKDNELIGEWSNKDETQSMSLRARRM